MENNIKWENPIINGRVRHDIIYYKDEDVIIATVVIPLMHLHCDKGVFKLDENQDLSVNSIIEILKLSNAL